MAFQPDNRYQAGGSAWGRTATTDTVAIDAGLRAYMLRVFNWMASGLLLTGIVAYGVASVPEIQALFWQVGRTASGMRTVSPTILGWAAMLSPLAFVLVLSFGINKMSKTTTQMVFWAFAAAMGASLSNIFLRYTGTSVASTFFISASMFASASLYGYTTKADLSKMGSIMMMGMIGILIAGLVNIFLQSPALQFAISVIGVVVFTALTAYDLQRIKSDYVEYSYAEGTDEAGKRSVLDALGLYLNFINIFQFLLSIMGQRSSN
ncbi:MAG: inhibitor (BI)/YccA family protein [Rhodospirillales bacterium]|jgi:FtsH-binding integral membrane protein|nr:inhibitor (BI)/YccA family protein [Rhodospirillales bacterium]MDB5383516.1 inhibitor (BI)/YccA family protein [Rhodospirillales bacterium]